MASACRLKMAREGSFQLVHGEEMEARERKEEKREKRKMKKKGEGEVAVAVAVTVAIRPRGKHRKRGKVSWKERTRGDKLNSDWPI